MHKYNPVTQDPKFSDDDYPATMQPIIINNNGEKLLGTFFVAGGKGPHPTVLLLHGFPGNEVNYDLAHSLRRFGCNVVVFHYRGSWGSSGCFT
ncbi:MAG: alpha/beta hydrolase, partial [Melioribacteraceae bacterium]|nr:alpha/beta hydrolase [Melioribacteraceae bacterium]